MKFLLSLAAAMTVIGWISGSSFAQTPKPPSASEFLLAAAQSDAYEIEAGRVAIVEAQDSKVRAFAQDMIDAHTRTSLELRKAAAASSLSPPPPIVGADQSRMLASLQSTRGAAFDRTYLMQQKLAHISALTIHQSYAKTGSDAHLRSAAEAAVPQIQHHLQMVEKLTRDE